MLFSELKDTKYKTFLLELAYLAVMVKRDIYYLNKSIDSSLNTESQEFNYYFDEDVVDSLRDYIEELKDNDFSKMLGFVNTVFSEKYLHASNVYKINSNGGLDYYRNYDSYNEVLKEDGEYTYLGCVFNKAIEDVLGEYMGNPIVKEQVVKVLLGGDLKLLSIDQNNIKQTMLKFGEIKIEILKNILNKFFYKRKNCVDSLSYRDKKLIVCELIYFIFNYGDFGEEEFKLMKVICNYIGVDLEYIEEFRTSIQCMVSVKREILDLVNE